MAVRIKDMRRIVTHVDQTLYGAIEDIATENGVPLSTAVRMLLQSIYKAGILDVVERIKMKEV